MQLEIRFPFKHFNIFEIQKTGGGVMMGAYIRQLSKE